MPTSTPAEVFSRRLRQLVREGQVQNAATRAGVALETLMRWRKGAGRINPRLDSLERLAAALQVPLDSLLVEVRGASDVREELASYTVQPPQQTGRALVELLRIALADGLVTKEQIEAALRLAAVQPPHQSTEGGAR